MTNPSKITFYSNKGEILLVILIGASLELGRLNIAPSKLKIVSHVEKLDVLSEILDMELVDNAEDNYILISSDDNLIAKINFVNKFGDETNFQINVKKILEVTHE